jgi:hypothetical protein
LRRYASARDLADDLGRYLRGEPILARPVRKAQRAWMWCRRNPWLAGALGSTAAALLGLIIVLWLYAAQNNRGRLLERAARIDSMRRALAGFEETAVSLLELARSLTYAAGEPAPQRRALEAIRQASPLRMEAERTARELEEMIGRQAVDEPARWERRTTELRSEAARWLDQIRCTRVHEIAISGRGTPLVAARDDGERFAMLANQELVAFDASGIVLQRAGLSNERGTWNRDEKSPEPPLKFVGPDRVRLDLDLAVYHWNTSNGKLEREPRSLPEGDAKRRRLPPRRSLPLSQEESVFSWPKTAEVRSESYAATWSSTEGSLTVRSLDPASRPILAWIAPPAQTRHASAVPFLERIQYLGFARNPRLLAIVGWRHQPRLVPGMASRHVLRLVDAATGQYADAEWPNDGTSVSVVRILPLSLGIASLEIVQDPAPAKQPARNQRVRLSVWNVSLPLARRIALEHLQRVEDFERSADGQLVTACGDHLVRRWDGLVPVTSLGLEPTGAFGLNPGRFNGTSEVWGAPAPRTVGSSWARDVGAYGYVWHGFVAGPAPGFVVQRAELRHEGDDRLRTELRDPRDGKVQKCWSGTIPRLEPGRDRLEPSSLMLVSDDRRYGLAVAEDVDDLWTIELWSIGDNRRPKTLGRYDAGYFGALSRGGTRQLKKDAGLNPAPQGWQPPWEFSPRAGWLLMHGPDRVNQGLKVEAWKLPEVVRTGAESFAWQPGGTDFGAVYVPFKIAEFDEGDWPLARFGPELFDLESG